MGEIIPKIFQIQFFRGTSRHHFVILLSISPFHDDSLIANLHAEEEKCGDLIDEITSCYLEDFIIHGCYRERRRNNSVLSLHLLEDKQSLRGEDCNVPKISMKLIGTLIFLMSSRR